MITQTQHTEIRARIARYEELRAGRTAVDTSESAGWPADAQVTNEERGQVEVFEWDRDKPDRYFLYIREATREAVTWMGDVIGRVIFGDEYKDNFGGVRRSIVVTGTNGIRYHGTYFKSAGDYARITAYKDQN